MAKWNVVVFLAVIGGIAVSAEDLLSPTESAADARIVSGWPAAEGQFPYMLYIRGITNIGHVTACAGSIIHQNWGLTAARCTAQRTLLMIRAGMVNINQPRVYMETSTYFTHPLFIDEIHLVSQPNDISVVRFDRNLQFNNFIQPIRLQRSADMNRDYAGVTMTTAGWGTTWTSGAVSDTLNWVHLRGVTNFVCLLMINSNFLVQSSTICAGPYNVTSQSICSGDSGVPLVLTDDDGQLTQVGVGSFVVSYGCHIGFPSGFVRPGHSHGWIRDVTGVNFDWNLSKADEVPSMDGNENILPIKVIE